MSFISLVTYLLLSVHQSSSSLCSDIVLIHVVPSAYDEELPGWNVNELYLLNLAENISTRFINNGSYVLPGLNLEIVDVATDDCVREGSLQDLVGVFEQISEKRCILGVVGLYCSRVTEVIASHLSHPNFGYIQLSMATSPLLNRAKYPYLYRMISSGVLFNTAVLKLMDEFNWKNISLIYDFSDVFFRSTGINFARQILRRMDINLLAFFPIRASGNHEILEDIVETESRVTYFSVTHEESSDILCDAYFHNYSWPQFTYIFVDDSLEDILRNENKCNKEELLQASEGVILLLNRLSNSDPFHTEIFYQQYLRESGISERDIVSGNLGAMQYYANVLYDQIWSFAFTINNSLPIIGSLNDSLKEGIKQSPFIRDTLAKELRKISFQGAHGKIQFNDENEVLTIIDIFQVRNGKQVLIGEYNPNTDKFSLKNFNREDIPKGDFEIRHDAIPLWLGVLAALCQGFFLLMFFITCAYIIYWRDAPEVKSTSLRINIIILIGCLMISVSSLFYNLENFSEASADSITAFCNLESWLFLYGINLVLVALMFRLLRIFIIFHYPKTKMRMLNDVHLVIYIGITSLFPLVYLVLIWTAADHIHQVPVVRFIFSIHDPHYTEHFYCSSNHTDVWVSLYYSWIGVLLIAILVLAIQTRHIKYNDFKDTKKMGAFIFIISMTLGTLLPMTYLLQRDVPVASYIFKSMLTLLIPFTCLSLQYFPKIFPVLTQRTLTHISGNLSFKDSKDQETSFKTTKQDQDNAEP